MWPLRRSRRLEITAFFNISWSFGRGNICQINHAGSILGSTVGQTSGSYFYFLPAFLPQTQQKTKLVFICLVLSKIIVCILEKYFIDPKLLTSSVFVCMTVCNVKKNATKYKLFLFQINFILLNCIFIKGGILGGNYHSFGLNIKQHNYL